MRRFELVVTQPTRAAQRCGVIDFLRQHNGLSTSRLMSVAMLRPGESTVVDSMTVYRIVTEREAFDSIREAIEAAL